MAGNPKDKFILDATASNRTIYEDKNNGKIIFLDIEKRLERKPTIFGDDTHLPFIDGCCHTVLFDPPYYWTNGKPDFYGIPDAQTFKEVWGENRKYPRYYGTDKFKTRSELTSYLYRSIKEFKRVLTKNGLLWVKWCENTLSLNHLLSFFNEWSILLKLPIDDKAQTQGNSQTYWLAFIPKDYVEGFSSIFSI